MPFSCAELTLIVLPGSRKLLLSDSCTHLQFKVPLEVPTLEGGGGGGERNLKKHKNAESWQDEKS